MSPPDGPVLTPGQAETGIGQHVAVLRIAGQALSDICGETLDQIGRDRRSTGQYQGAENTGIARPDARVILALCGSGLHRPS
jgi:hypothetical protein